MDRYESNFTGYQDYRIYYQTWAAKNPKCHLIITHGQAEHSDSYHRVVSALMDLPIKIWAWDWRGHGKSDGLRGYAEHFNDYVLDFELFMNLIDQSQPALPKILLGHSMGGLIQLKALLGNPNWSIKAQVCSAPMLGLSVQVPAIKQVSAKLANLILPKLTLSNEIKDTDLSRDKDVLQEYKRDVHRHGKISAGVYLGSMEAIDYVLARPDRVNVPTLFQLPEKDPIVSTPASIQFFNQLTVSPKSMKIYADRKHESYNDLERQLVFEDLIEFLKEQI